jgi:hypothetical protein
LFCFCWRWKGDLSLNSKVSETIALTERDQRKKQEKWNEIFPYPPCQPAHRQGRDSEQKTCHQQSICRCLQRLSFVETWIRIGKTEDRKSTYNSQATNV